MSNGPVGMALYKKCILLLLLLLFRGRGNRQHIEIMQMTLNCLEKLRILEINNNYKMILIN